MSYNSALEARLSNLERHLHALLRWQKVVEALPSKNVVPVPELSIHDVLEQDLKDKPELSITVENIAKQTLSVIPTASKSSAGDVEVPEPAKEMLSIQITEPKNPADEVKGISHLNLWFLRMPKRGS